MWSDPLIYTIVDDGFYEHGEYLFSQKTHASPHLWDYLTSINTHM